MTANEFSILHLSSEEGGAKVLHFIRNPGGMEGDGKANGRWPRSCFLETFHPLVYLGNHMFFCQDSDKLWFKPLPLWMHARSLGHHDGAVPS